MEDRSGNGVRCPCCARAIDGPPDFVHPAVPVVLNVLAASEREAREAPRGRLELYECPACGTVFNRAFAGVPYGPEYFLDATRSPRYLAHLDDVCDRLGLRMVGRESFSVVDVGGGQGLFLVHLVARLEGRVSRAHVFDPAFRPDQARLPANVGFTPSLLDEKTAADLGWSPDVVVTRHVVEHVADPVSFVASFRRAFRSPFELLVETPNVDHTLDQGLLHDFCYEHPVMLGASGLRRALRSAGYGGVAVDSDVFGGEYLCGFASSAGGDDLVPRVDADPAPDERSGGRLATLARRFVDEHRDRLRCARQHGPVAIWGGAGKGALLAHLLDPERQLIEHVVDIHPGKRGSFLPGAGHRVVSPEEAAKAGVRAVVVANPTYAAEIAAQCRAWGLNAEVICAGSAA